MSSSYVLLVDDHDDGRELLEEFLTMSDFSVASAASGAQALEVIATRGTPAVVITDLTLGDMDGLDLARTIRSTPATANVPIVAATGHSGFDDPERIFAQVLVKPVALATLVETLKKTIK